MQVVEYNEMGKDERSHELPFKYSMMLPASENIDAA